MSRRAIAAGLLALLGASTHVAAIFIRIDTVQVPIDRLVVNLENELLAKPKDVQTMINLGRLHAMAYSLKSDTFPAAGVPERPSYPPGSPELPRNVQPAKTPEQTAAAARHLKESIRQYGDALALAPDNMTARLGHGWVLEQSGDTTGAIADYRAVVKQAWQEDQKLRGLGPTERVFTNEAAGYLIPLLDKQRDAEEIADLQSKQAKIRALPRAITPVAIPLMDDVSPAALVDDRARVRFDADGTGARDWTWIAPDAGWLVYDATGRGEITSALQLFGNVTFWLFWSNGYEPMRALDDNHDGELAGPELRQLAIWRDADRDGVADRGEVLPLASHAIAALSCDHVEVDDARFAAISPAGVRLTDGTTRPTYDILLRTSADARTRP